MLLTGDIIALSWKSESRVLWLCLTFNLYILVRSDETIAIDSGAAPDAHCLTRGVDECYAQGMHLHVGRWKQADKIEARIKRHNGDRENIGSVRVRARYEVRVSRYVYMGGGGAVATI